MRNNTLTIVVLLLISAASIAQSEIDAIGIQLIKVFDNTKAIKELTFNRNKVLGQLQDIQQWQSQQNISPSQSEKLATSYLEYATVMNKITEDIAEDLGEISSYRDIKGARLDRFIKKFELTYSNQLLEAYRIYTDGFLPNFNAVSSETNSKGGIIGSILLILEFGDTIFSAIKSIFSTNDKTNESRDTLIRLAMDLVATKITDKLTYPTWEEMGLLSPSELKTSVPAVQVGDSRANSQTSFSRNPLSTSQPDNSEENNTAAVKKLGLTFFGTEERIELEKIDKGIVVGSSNTNSSSIRLFATTHPLDVGDKFWVTLEGEQYTKFFYYDEHLDSWQDPFGKGIIVGGNYKNSGAKPKVYLPSNSSYFEITDETANEHFLILVSNEDISKEVDQLIFAETTFGVTFLENLEKSIPLRYPSLNINSELELLSQEITPTFHAIYITIPKNKI